MAGFLTAKNNARLGIVAGTAALLFVFVANADVQSRQQFLDQAAEKNRQQYEQVLQQQRKQQEEFEKSSRDYARQVEERVKQQNAETDRIHKEAVERNKQDEMDRLARAQKMRDEAGDPERN